MVHAIKAKWETINDPALEYKQDQENSNIQVNFKTINIMAKVKSSSMKVAAISENSKMESLKAQVNAPLQVV